MEISTSRLIKHRRTQQAMMTLAMTSIHTLNLDCGATLVVEQIAGVASAAMTWLLPIGTSSDDENAQGVSTILSEIIYRGAGNLSSREHSDALDRIGIQRSSQVLTQHLRIGCVALGSRLQEAIPLFTSMIREPAFNDDALQAIKSLCLQSLDSLEDEPQRMVMIKLREAHMPSPFNRHSFGQRDVIENCSLDDLHKAWQERCTADGTIISAAGAVDPQSLREQLNDLLKGWSGKQSEPTKEQEAQRGTHHLEQDSAQVHIGIAMDAPRESDKASMLERVAIAVLSGGSSGRLFTEVRQKRSLCYSVGASYSAGRDRGLITVYSGTTPERYQETLEVCLAEIKKLEKGVDADELQRAITGIKSHLIMQGESTTARASAIAQDYFRINKARSLDELSQEVDKITLDELNSYLASRNFGEFTIYTVGTAEQAVV